MILTSMRARIIISIAIFFGLFASVYLFFTYLTGTQIVCALVSGCESVRASAWARVAGIPRPLIGILFYSTLFMILIFRAATPWKERLARWLTKIIILVGFLESLYLLYVQGIQIKAWCLWCLISAGASIMMFVFLFWDRVEPFHAEERRQELQYYFITLLTFFFIGGAGLARLTGAW